MSISETERDRLNSWPTVSEQDIERLNDLFPHYLFFRREGDLMGLGGVRLWSSCCGRKEYRPYLVRTETPKHRELLVHLRHKEKWSCPWCGRSVTLIDLSRAGQRKTLARTELAVLLHGAGEALYADALVLHKEYANESDLTARPTAWCSSGYRFAQGEVMQASYQDSFDGRKPVITYERDKLSRQKEVQEPFKCGSISFYRHEPYYIINRESLREHPFFRYCGFFDLWQYRPGGGRGYAAKYSDLVSYLTAYSIYPRQVEMLAKAGYWSPIEDLVYKRKKNVEVMCWEETDPRLAFGMDRQELAWLMGAKPPMETLSVRNYVRRHWGKVWSIYFCADFCNIWCGGSPMEVLRFAHRYRLDPDRLMRYFDKFYLRDEEQMEPVSYPELFELYRDYLDAAWTLGWCLDHSKVLWPEDLTAAHDKATGEVADRTAELQAQSRKERRQKYEFELDGLRIIFPATVAAIKREGKALKHCVGGYAERHMKGVLTILFLRRAETPSTPYITIEMAGNRIIQIHGYDNERRPGAVKPREVHKEFLDTWTRWLKYGSKRNEDGTPKLPKRRKAVEHGPVARTA